MGLVARKPIFRIPDKVRLKPVYTATETSSKNEISLVRSLDMVLSKQIITKALIRLHMLVWAFVVRKPPKTGFHATRPIFIYICSNKLKKPSSLKTRSPSTVCQLGFPSPYLPNTWYFTHMSISMKTQFDYSLHKQTLENFQSAKYLGITITDNMDCGQHVSEISSNATKTLGFLRRNLAFAPRSTKEVAYKTLGWPKLEYAAPIWSPH